MSEPSENSRYGMNIEDTTGVMTLKSKQHVTLIKKHRSQSNPQVIDHAEEQNLYGFVLSVKHK